MILYKKNTAYTDADIAFSLRTYYNTGLTRQCLKSLRKSFPKARVMVISDGDNSTPSDFKEFNVEFHCGNHLYYAGAGGRLIQRMLELFLRGDEETLVKIDPDTKVWRRFYWIPEGYGMWGTLQNDGYINSIQGGCTLISNGAANMIENSGLLLMDALKDYNTTYALSPFIKQYCDSGKLGEDWIIGYVNAILGIPMYGFTEVKSLWDKPPLNVDLEFAVTHPHKEENDELWRT